MHGPQVCNKSDLFIVIDVQGPQMYNNNSVCCACCAGCGG